MNREEFLEKYGDHEVEFRSYYKYTFTFVNDTLEIRVGGDAEDIYRLEVLAGKKYKVRDLDPYAAYIRDEEIYHVTWRW